MGLEKISSFRVFGRFLLSEFQPLIVIFGVTLPGTFLPPPTLADDSYG